MASFFDRTSVNLVGVTLRNTDDCAFTSRQSFLIEFANCGEHNPKAHECSDNAWWRRVFGYA